MLCLYLFVIVLGAASANPVLRVLPKPAALAQLAISDAPLLLWHTHNEVLSAIWSITDADEPARLQSVELAVPTASVQFVATLRGTITVTQQDDVTPFTVTALGIRVGTIELLPSDDYPSGIRACTSTSFCLDIFSPEPGTLDFVAHADVRAEAGGLLSMSSLEEWYSVLIDGPPTVSQALEALGANLGDAEPLAALGGGKGAQQEQTYIASRRLLLKGTQLQRLGRPTVLGWED